MRSQIFILLLVAWPLQALFTVRLEQEAYEAELHGNVSMACLFTPIPSTSELSVIWRRIEPAPAPAVEVYRLERGRVNPNLIGERFRTRARLLMEELKKYRAVLELTDVRIDDSGTYECIVSQNENDYKQTRLAVRAPYTDVRTVVTKLSVESLMLYCESHGYPLARVVWSNGRQLAVHSNSSHEVRSDGVFNVTSRLIVPRDDNNYTCSFVTEDISSYQTASFHISDEFLENARWSSVYAAVGVIAVMGVGVGLASLFLRRRKKGSKQTSHLTAEDPPADRSPVMMSTDVLLPKTEFCADPVTFSTR